MAWTDGLVNMTLQHLAAFPNEAPNGQWVSSLIGPPDERRGSYFFRRHWQDEYPVGNNRAAFHMLINHYAHEPNLTCGVRLETWALPGLENEIPNQIHELFAGVLVRHYYGQKPAQDLVNVLIPLNDFDPYLIEQAFPDWLQVAISEQFFANQQVIDFLLQP